MRKHSNEQISQLMSSIAAFGFVRPIIAEEGSNAVIDGEAVLQAATQLGHGPVPVVFVKDLTPAKAAALRIGLNRLQEKGEFDPEALSDALKDALDIGIDSEALGFNQADLDVALAIPEAINSADDEPLAPVSDPFVLHHDMFALGARGQHKLMCGDSRSPEDCSRLMDAKTAGMVFMDPPWNVRVNGHISKRKGARRHREFLMGSSEMTRPGYHEFIDTVVMRAAEQCDPGAIIDVCMDWRGIEPLLAAGARANLDYINLAVWAKHSAGMGSFYRSAHELIAIFRKPGAPHVNNIQLGANGRYRTNVWRYEGRAGFSKGRKEDLDRHPTPKPVAMVADAILDCTNRNAIVLDLFGGGGTTLMAAEKTGRCGYLMELDPGYVQASLLRFLAAFGHPVIHIESGLSLDELAKARREQTSHGMHLAPAPGAFK